MSILVQSVISILFSISFHHRQFQALMGEVNAHYSYLLCFSEVRWLSCGAMFSRVCNLQQYIRNFLREDPLLRNYHFDLRWLAGLVLPINISVHLNALNVYLQFKDILRPNINAHITTFEVKPIFLEDHLITEGQCMPFPRLTACSPEDMGLDTCFGVAAFMLEEFEHWQGFHLSL